MRGNQVQKKGGGFKTVIFFIVGIILGIAIVVGAVAGGALYVLNSDLDGVLSMFGVDNSKDEETGKNKVVNTDPDNGGVTSVLDLISKITAMAQDTQNLTLGQIDALVPATRGLVDQLSAAIEQYVTVDYDELSAIKFSEFGAYLEGVVMNIQPAAFLDNLNLEGSANIVLEKLLYGLESNCVTDPATGEKYPIMVDNFKYVDGAYKRVEDGAVLSNSQYIIKQSADNDLYDIFFFEYNGNYYITERDAHDIQKFGFAADSGHLYGMYNAEYAENTGNYYINAAGEKTVLEPVTIGSLMDGNGLGALEKMRVTELLSGELADDELIGTLLGDISIGDLINGNVNFQDKVNEIELGAFLAVESNDAMLLYFVYGLTNLSSTPDGQGRYTATYKLGVEDITAYVTVEGGKITSVTDEEGNALAVTTVGSINNTIDNIEISIFVDVTTDNGILPYLAYGITGLKEVDGLWTAKLDGEDCTVQVSGNKIISVTDSEGNPVPAAGIDELSGRVNGVMDNLTIGDIIDPDGNKILEQLATYKINELSSAMNTLEIGGLIDIPADNKILAYLAYGITEININTVTQTATGKLKTDDREQNVYITLKKVQDKEEYNITGVYTTEEHTPGTEVPGTTINGINDRIGDITETLYIKDIIEINPDNPLMVKIGDCKISEVGSVVETITLPDVMAIPSDNAIMAFLAYSITDINTENNTAVLHKKLPDGTYTTTTVQIETDGKNITKVTEGTSPVGGTLVNEVGEKVTELTETLKIGDIIEIEGSGKLMQKIKDSTISGVGALVDELTLPDVMDIPADNKIMAYLAYGITEIDGTNAKHNGEDVVLTIQDDYITGVTKNGEPVEGTGINEVGGKVDELTKTLKIKDLIDTSTQSGKLMDKIGDCTIADVGNVVNELTLPDVMDIPADNAIMAFLAYGITEIDGTSAKLNGEAVTLTIVGDNITEVTKDGESVPGTKIEAVGGKVNELTTTLKIKDIVNKTGSSKLMQKIGECTISSVSDVVNDLTLPDVIDIPANSAIIVYLAYGINEVNAETNTAKQGGETVNLTIVGGNITEVTKDGAPVDGTKISDLSSKISGLMDTLTIGELIEVPEDNTILNAIKDSTISGIGKTIDSLTLNELYANEIYKVSSYEDRDNNGQYDKEKDGDMTYIDAKLRKAVSGEPSDADKEIKFNANYLYYTKDENGSYHLVQMEGKDLGKLDSLPSSGEYYTYGAVQGMWTLLLTDESGAETPLKLNNIGSVITGVANRLKSSTLNDLDKAGILDFTDDALKTEVNGKALGEFTLDEALSELITMVEFYNRYSSYVGGLGH